MTSLEALHKNLSSKKEEQLDKPIDTDTELDRPSIQDRHPDWPQLNVLGYFSRHENPEDRQGMARRIKGAHIYFIEAPAQDQRVRVSYNK